MEHCVNKMLKPNFRIVKPSSACPEVTQKTQKRKKGAMIKKDIYSNATKVAAVYYVEKRTMYHNKNFIGDTPIILILRNSNRNIYGN